MSGPLRRWSAGDEFDQDGVLYRVEPGYKGPGDLRLDWFVGGRWRTVHMRSGFLLADFFYENEDILYPPVPNQRTGRTPLGGMKYIKSCKHAGRFGWRTAEAELRLERESRLF